MNYYDMTIQELNELWDHNVYVIVYRDDNLKVKKGVGMKYGIESTKYILLHQRTKTQKGFEVIESSQVINTTVMQEVDLLTYVYSS